MRILVVNAGSSSLKGALIEPPDRTLARSEVAWGHDSTQVPDQAGRVAALVAALRADAGDDEPIDAVGHRVVHGGPDLTAAAVVDEAVLDGIRAAQALAPLHNGVALGAIDAARAALPDVPHVACFDTAFHATLPEEAWRYPLPREWEERWGVRRHGFHGSSVAWSVGRAGELLGRPVRALSLVVAHLGSGCSVTAVEGGRSVDTSMGWTPLEGLMMGTRAGSVDPGILLRLLEDGRLTVDELGEALDHRSGLLAVAGTADMRMIVRDADRADPASALALAMFVRRVAAAVAGAATSLPMLDALVFTGGIGEGSPVVRAAVVARLGALGVVGPLLDDVEGDAVLTPGGVAVAVLRIAAREDLVVARDTAALLGG